ncbi:MAG TPA: NAD(P)H-dependent glycerol-3-phosphate dehydrogenase [Fimbriiglobus sp.]|jgi:glycerol-3-phosphate dehydrogenase (NAD(P)+)
MPTISVFGSGGWGTAVAVLLAQKPDISVRLWGARAGTVARLNESRENLSQLPGVTIPGTVRITAEPSEAADGADGWVTAIPTAFLRPTLERLRNAYRTGTPIVSLTKGIEHETFRRPSEIIADVLGASPVAVLSGPSHAEEVARGMPTSVAVASPDAATATWIQELFGTDRFRVYTNADLIGVELAGALKNVIGIAAGICDGLGFGDNAKAALLTRGLVEMTRFGVAHGADPATFAGLAGLGDLITTCYSPHGRNRRVGERLAKGEPLSAVTAGPQVAEGVYTSQSVFDRTARMGVDTPIMAGVYDVLYRGRPPLEAVQALLARTQKRENAKG